MINKKHEAEWTSQHILSKEQLKQLIQDKINRLESYYNVKKMPERDFSVAQ